MPRPIHFSMAIVDIENFGTRNDADQRWLRSQMYDVLGEATDRAGIPWDQCDAVERGDGLGLLIRATVSKAIVAEGFVRALQAGLRAHHLRSREDAAMRMRLALHAGEAGFDGRNWVGTELNTACRLAELPELRQVLQAVPTAHLAVCVSDLWFRTVVWQDPGLVDHRTYLPIMVRVKEFHGRVWLHVPDTPGYAETGLGHPGRSMRPW